MHKRESVTSFFIIAHNNLLQKSKYNKNYTTADNRTTKNKNGEGEW